MNNYPQITELEEYIEDLKALKEGRIDLDSVDGQALLQATIIVFEILREEAEIAFTRMGRH